MSDPRIRGRSSRRRSVVPPPPPDAPRVPISRRVVTDEPHRRGTAFWEPTPGLPPPRLVSFRLTVMIGSQAGAVFSFTAGHAGLGTHRTNELELRDPTVSGFHCQIRVEADGMLVKDLGSLNGTFVDGVRVREAHLTHGCLLGVGRVVLKFELG